MLTDQQGKQTLMSASLIKWLSAGPFAWIGLILLAILIQLILLRKLSDGAKLFKQSLHFAGFIVVLALTSLSLDVFGLHMGSELSGEMAMLCWGLLLIRLAGLFIFRIAMPFIKLPQPRIHEDILLVLAYFAWGLVRLRIAGLDVSSLVTTSAVITAVLAFAMQDTLGNILGGLALQLDNSVRIGDWVKVDDIRGKVVQVQWRHTAVRTNNGEIIILPNSVLTKSKVNVFSNIDSPHSRRWIPFAVGYPVPPQQVIDTVEKSLREALIDNVAATPAPQCIVTDYRDGSTHYAVRYWLTRPEFDDGTDSVIRVHLYSALQRQNFTLANPCLDINVSTETDETAAINHAREMQKRLHAMRQVNLFASLSEAELNQLAASLRGTPFTKNDVMTRQGAVAHWLYILVKGEASVWFEMDNQERRLLANLSEGAIFGEMGLMTGAPRRATVIANSDAYCYRLDKESFENILRARPDLAEEFARILSERNQELNQSRYNGAPAILTQQASLLVNIKKFFGL